MARTNSKTKDMKLPKYLKLVKGTMWLDTVGTNCSNITLYNIKTQFIGRGHITDDEWEDFQEQGYIEQKEIPSDKNNNIDSSHGEYGFVKLEDDKSVFCTDDVPKEKLGNIITAFKSGVLVEFNPKKEAKEVAAKEQKKTFKYNQKGDIVFSGKNKHMFDKLNNSPHDELIAFITTAPINAKNNLMDLYDYEIQGFNRLSRPRDTVLSAIRTKLNSFGPSMSPITVDDFDGDDTKE